MMRTLNKTLIALAISASFGAGLAYADTYNPFIDNSQPSNQSSNQNTQTNNNASSLQPSNPTYNFSQKPSIVAPQPFIKSNSGPGAANPSPNLNPSSPSIGPGGTQPAPFGPGGLQPSPLGPGGIQPSTPLGPGGTAPSSQASLLQAILNLDSDVKNTNKLTLTQWNQTVQNQAQANAMLLPTNLNFLWGQSAYQNMQQLVPSTQFQQNSLQNMLSTYAQSLCGIQGANCQSSNQPSSGMLGQNASSSPYSSNLPTQMMTPQAINQYSSAALGQATPSNISLANTNYISNLIGMTSNTAVQSSQTTQLSMLAASTYVLSNIAASNQVDTTDGIDSQMNIINSAVTAPLSNTPDPTTNQTWFQQLSVASTPQLLRSVAVMLAMNNYLQYQNLKAAQNEQLLQAAQLVEQVRIEQSLTQLDSNEAGRQSAALSRIANLLQNMQH
jgi:hypothetical protein